jgi:hypothetical protein
LNDGEIRLSGATIRLKEDWIPLPNGGPTRQTVGKFSPFKGTIPARVMSFFVIEPREIGAFSKGQLRQFQWGEANVSLRQQATDTLDPKNMNGSIMAFAPKQRILIIVNDESDLNDIVELVDVPRVRR